MHRLSLSRALNSQRIISSLVICLGCLLIELGVALLANQLAPSSWLPIAAVIALTLVPFAVAATRRSIDLGEPIYVVAVLYLIGFPLRALYMRDNSADVVRLGSVYYDDYLGRGLLVAGVGFGFLLLGYYSRVARFVAARLPSLPRNFAPGAGVGRVAVIGMAGLAVWVYQLAFLGRTHGAEDALSYSAGNGLIVQLSEFVVYAAALMAILLFGRVRALRPHAVLLVALAAVPALYVSLAQVQRYALVAAIAAVALPWHYRRSRLRVPVALGALILAMCVVFPAVGVMRQIEDAKPGTGLGVALSRGNEAIGSLFGNGMSSYWTQTRDTTMNRLHGADSLAGIVKFTPTVQDYEYGRDYALVVPLAVIPRAFWPGKPRITSGETFAPTYFNSHDYTTHVMAYTVGDLYMNFWWAGVIVGSFILGVVYRAAHLYCIERTRAGEIGVFIYVALFLSLVAIEWDLSTIVFNVLKSLIVVAGIIWFMRLRLSTADVRWVPARGGTRG